MTSKSTIIFASSAKRRPILLPKSS